MYSEAIRFRPRTETEASQKHSSKEPEIFILIICAKRNIIFAIGENIIPWESPSG